MQQKTQQVQDETPYREAREKAGLKQSEAYAAIPVGKRSMIHYEKGSIDPPADVVIRMDKIYGCDGELIKVWLRKLGFDGTIKFSKRKSTTWTVIQAVLRKIFNLRQL